MTTRKRFGNVADRATADRQKAWLSLQEDELGRGELKQTCGCCGQDAIMLGTFFSELGVTLPHYWGRKPLCSECRHGLTALAGSVR